MVRGSRRVIGPRRQVGQTGLAAHGRSSCSDMPPSEAAQEGPQGGGALTTQPTPTVPDSARSASASSMQSPPRPSFGATGRNASCPHSGARPGRRPIKVMVDDVPQARCRAGRRERQAGNWPPAHGRQRGCRYSGPVLYASSLLGAVYTGRSGCSKTGGIPIRGCPRWRGSSRAVPKNVLRRNVGLTHRAIYLFSPRVVLSETSIASPSLCWTALPARETARNRCPGASR